MEREPAGDPFDLERFVTAQNQDGIYDTAVRELRAGRKQSDFMWFIFPQMRGLGSTQTAHRYGIGCRAEAAAYLQHEVLGPRLRRCTNVVLRSPVTDARLLLGSELDVKKLKSSMTLFATVAEEDRVFIEVLRRYFHGGRDLQTLELLQPTAVAVPDPASAPRRQAFWRRLFGGG